MTYDFDRLIERRGTASVKWDLADTVFGGSELLPLWVADMDFAAPPEVITALEQRARHGIYGYTATMEGYNQAIINWMTESHGWSIEQEWIQYAPGVVLALFLLIKALSQPGDAVIIQKPVYYPFMKAIEANGRRIVNNPLVYHDGRYRMDLDHLDQCAVKEKAHLILLCNPHNPVGRTWDRSELLELGRICHHRNIIIIADEIHGDIVYPGYHFTPIASLSDDLAARTVTCTSPSKTFNLAGLQTANLIISNRDLRKKWRNEISRTGIWGPNCFGATALETAYCHGRPWLRALLLYLSGNIQYMIEECSKRLPRLRIIKPEGTYLVWMDLREYGSEPYHLAKRITQEAGLALDHGYYFGSPEGDGFERINIACPRSILEKAIHQLAHALNE